MAAVAVQVASDGLVLQAFAGHDLLSRLNAHLHKGNQGLVLRSSRWRSCGSDGLDVFFNVFVRGQSKRGKR